MKTLTVAETLNNKFAILAVDDEEKITKKQPFSLRERNSLFTYKKGTIDEIKLETYSEENYKTPEKYFNQVSKNYYTFQLFE